MKHLPSSNGAYPNFNADTYRVLSVSQGCPLSENDKIKVLSLDGQHRTVGTILCVAMCEDYTDCVLEIQKIIEGFFIRQKNAEYFITDECIVF